MKKLLEGILCGINIVNTLGLLATFVSIMFRGGISDLQLKLTIFFITSIAVGVLVLVAFYLLYGETTEATKVMTKYNR